MDRDKQSPGGYTDRTGPQRSLMKNLASRASRAPAWASKLVTGVEQGDDDDRTEIVQHGSAAPVDKFATNAVTRIAARFPDSDRDSLAPKRQTEGQSGQPATDDRYAFRSWHCESLSAANHPGSGIIPAVLAPSR